MAEHWIRRCLAKELAEQEAYAKKQGYTIDERNQEYSVTKDNRQLAICLLRVDAVRIAYSLANTFGIPEWMAGIQDDQA